MNEDSIFAKALALNQPEERAAFLDEACAGRPQLRAQVEELLAADASAGSFLNHPAVGAEATVAMTDAGGETEKAAHWSGVLPFLEPCDKPDRIGKIDHYEIMEVVGHGGFGAVLRAFDTKLSRVVAVKVLAPELAANPSAVKRFLREAQTAAQVHHDHVVTIHAVDETHRPPYLVMQFVEGRTLQQKIEAEGALSLVQILRIGSQCAAGLAAAHKLGLIHRDVKPGNILLENGVERVKITDFGLARAADDLEMTQTGVIAGTPLYMSPEQAKGEPIDARSDLFSLGSVLYTMCTGRGAFRAESTMGVLRRVCDDEPRPIREVNGEIPPWLEAIVMKLLAKRPEDRFQSAAEVAELLEQHLAHVQNPAQATRPATVVLARPPVPDAKPAPAPSAQQGTMGVALVVMLIMLVVPVAAVLIATFVAILVPSLYARRTSRPAAMASPAQPPVAFPAMHRVAPPSMDLTGWGTFLDPSGQCRLEREASAATLHVPGTQVFNFQPLAGGDMSAPRLFAEVEGDFVIEVQVLPFSRVDTSGGQAKSATWQSAGLYLQEGPRKLVRWERVSWAERYDGAPMLHAEWFADGQKHGDDYTPFAAVENEPTWLQIERQDQILTLRQSHDGRTWSEYKRIDNLDLPARVQLGVVAVNTARLPLAAKFANLKLLDPILGWGSSWSPDSRLLVRQRNRRTEHLTRAPLQVVDFATGREQPALLKGKDPCWSPVAGGPIAYVVQNDEQVTSIWVVDPKTSRAREVSDGSYVCGWSPDGKTLFDYRLVDRSLRAIDWEKEKAEPEVVLQLSEGAFYPQVSPDGLRVAACAFREGGPFVEVREIDSGKLVAEAVITGWQGVLCGWSADSKLLGYSDYGLGDTGLYVLDVASGKSRKVLDGPYTLPRWSPDGKWIAVDDRTSGAVFVFAAMELLQPEASAEIKALRDLVAAKESNSQRAQAQVAGEILPPLSAKRAEIELLEARIRLAEAEGDRAAVAARMADLVKAVTAERSLAKQRVDAGIESPSVLDEIDARLADATARQAAAEAKASGANSR